MPAMRHLVILSAATLICAADLGAQVDSVRPGPPDQPIGVTTQQQQSCLDSALAPYIAQGKATYPAAKARYLAGLPANSRFFVSAMLFDSMGHRELVFISVTGFGHDTASGRLASDLAVVRGFDQDASMRILDEAVLDWTIARPDGTEEGNAIGKYIDTLHGRPPC
jgi:hypothetical protein